MLPSRPQLKTGPFLLYSNLPLATDSPEVRCLTALEHDLSRKLGWQDRREDTPVEVYVLNDRNAFTHFLRFYYPELPPRRAFFLAVGSQRLVYTYRNDRLEEDLRHEATHALLHGQYGELSLWLDEGLAEYFENSSAGPGDEHLERIREDLRTGWKPDLERLENLTDIHQMSPRDYREAWAWVHFILEDTATGTKILDTYLARENETDRPFSHVLARQGLTNERLLSHLAEASKFEIARKSSVRRPEPTIRGQDQSIELPPVPMATPKVGLIRRVASFLGL